MSNVCMFLFNDDEYYLNNYVIDEYNGRYKRGEVNYGK